MKWLKAHPEPVNYGKGNTLVPASSTCLVTKTGYSVLFEGR